MKTFLLLALLTACEFASAQLSLKVVTNSAREIDQQLVRALKKQDHAPRPLADDATFLRRSYLGIIGRIPTHEEAKEFLDSGSPDKKRELIETLVSSSAMDSRLFNFWADLYRLESKREIHGTGWHLWLQDAVRKNEPYDEVVYQMLAAKGHTAENPAVGYYLRDRGMLLDNISNTAQIFHGQQIGCAQCHDHPFDEHTQMEYYELAAFLGHTEYRFQKGQSRLRTLVSKDLPTPRKKNRRNRMINREMKEFRTLFRYHSRNAISENPKKALKLPRDYQYKDGEPGEEIAPRTFYGKEIKKTPLSERREAFAAWATDPEHPYFTKVIANRLWAYVFGFGLVPTLDDFSDVENSPYLDLLITLEQAMKATDYNVKEYLRILYHTDLFSRHSSLEETKPGFSFAFTGPALRRLKAEEIRDSFVTLQDGNIDKNRNHSLAQGWSEYVDSYHYIMGASLDELREINEIAVEGQMKDRAMVQKLSEVRKELKEARASGKKQLVQKLNRQLRKIQRSKYEDNKNKEAETPAEKAQAGLSRRIRSSRNKRQNRTLRSSELLTPFEGGSILQEFGASDRKTPDAAKTVATVPQTLRLLNGAETSFLTSRRNQFAKRLRGLETPEERLNHLFLSLYSSYPSAIEKEQFLPETKTQESTLILARAILTSNRFLFVQ